MFLLPNAVSTAVVACAEVKPKRMNSLCISASRPLPSSATVPSSLNTVKEPTASVISALVATSLGIAALMSSNRVLLASTAANMPVALSLPSSAGLPKVSVR